MTRRPGFLGATKADSLPRSKPFVIRWCDAFMRSPDLPSTSKHCLHVLRTFMNADGYARPSIWRIAALASLSERAVRGALIRAVDAGWILRWQDKEKARSRGQQWANYEYQARIAETAGGAADSAGPFD